MADITELPSALRDVIRRTWSSSLRAEGLPGVQFSEPLGDPGLFGPDSAIWYVHSDITSLIGGLGGLLLGALDEPTLYGTNAHSSYSDDPLARLGRTASFVNAMTWASTPVVEHVCDLVHRMHRSVHGTMPDGRTYAANDSDQLIWTAVSQAHGVMSAHLRYHPEPLAGTRIDEYYAQYGQFAARLGATGPTPTTEAGVEAYFSDRRPSLSFGPQTAELAEFFRRPIGNEPAARAVSRLISRAAFDTLPPWAKQMYGLEAPGCLGGVRQVVDTQVTRQSALALLATLRWALGTAPVAATARDRCLGVTSASAA
jgi:uncharacterized protein (DUF2236 family)